MIMEQDFDSSLRDLPAKGFIRFTIKATDTEANTATHEAFKAFCTAECDNNYTLGIRRLLEHYEEDYKHETIWNAIADINHRIDEIDNKVSAPKAPTEGAPIF
jgi:hypothetical protein